jgi:hypothetical protein
MTTSWCDEQQQPCCHCIRHKPARQRCSAQISYSRSAIGKHLLPIVVACMWPLHIRGLFAQSGKGDPKLHRRIRTQHHVSTRLRLNTALLSHGSRCNINPTRLRFPPTHPRRPDRVNWQLTPTCPPPRWLEIPSFHSIKPLGFPFIRAFSVPLCTLPVSAATSLMPSKLCVMSWKRDDYGFWFFAIWGKGELQCLCAQIVLVTRHNHGVSWPYVAIP